MFDSSASFGAGDNEGVLADAQGASGYIVCIHLLGLGGRDEADFAVRAILGKDAQSVSMGTGPELNFQHELIGRFEEWIYHE